MIDARFAYTIEVFELDADDANEMRAHVARRLEDAECCALCNYDFEVDGGGNPWAYRELPVAAYVARPIPRSTIGKSRAIRIGAICEGCFDNMTEAEIDAQIAASAQEWAADDAANAAADAGRLL